MFRDSELMRSIVNISILSSVCLTSAIGIFWKNQQSIKIKNSLLLLNKQMIVDETDHAISMSALLLAMYMCYTSGSSCFYEENLYIT